MLVFSLCFPFHSNCSSSFFKSSSSLFLQLNDLPSPSHSPTFTEDLTFFFRLCRAACRILVPRPGIEPSPSAVKVPCHNHWTAREFPILIIFIQIVSYPTPWVLQSTDPTTSFFKLSIMFVLSSSSPCLSLIP